MNLWRLWFKSLVHGFLTHPLRALLAIGGVALGVCVVLSIRIASDSALKSFRSASETLRGPATHRIVGGPNGVPESVYVDLRKRLGVRDITPVIEAQAIGDNSYTGQWHLLGIDPLSTMLPAPMKAALTSKKGDFLRLLTMPNSVLISSETAKEFGIKAGDNLPVRLHGRPVKLQVQAVLNIEDDLSQSGLAHTLILDIATLQDVSEQWAVVSYINVHITPGDQITEVRLRSELPRGVTLVSASDASRSAEALTASFRNNLTAMGLLTWLIGLFLVYQAIAYAVLVRQREFGLLRCLGMGRGELLSMVLAEASVWGVLGVLIGIALGIWGGHQVSQVMGQTMQSLYAAPTSGRITLQFSTLLGVTALGLGGTLVAALWPAWQSTWVPPRASLDHSALEQRIQQWLRRWFGLALLALVLSLSYLLWQPQTLWIIYLSLFVAILGYATLAPSIAFVLFRIAAQTMRQTAHPLIAWSLRGLVDSASRTALALAVLTVAQGASLGVSTMVVSFRSAVSDWLNYTLQADVYLSPTGPSAGRLDTPLDPQLLSELRAMPGIAEVHVFRRALIQADNMRWPILAVRGGSQVTKGYTLIEGNPTMVWPAWHQQQGILVSESFARKHHLVLGQVLRLPTDAASPPLAILGVFTDFGSEEGTLLIPDELYRRLWHDEAISSAGIFLKPGHKADVWTQHALSLLYSNQAFELRPSGTLRRQSLVLFDQTFKITTAMEWMIGLVAATGMLGALLALGIDRKKQYAVLRAMGASRQELVLSLALVGPLLGLVAGFLAIPCGLGLGWALVYVINTQTFGWSFPLVWHVEVMLRPMLMGLVIGAVASVYPLWRATKVAPAEALRSE